jgi:Domain of unknown function (DUF4440)
MTDTLIRGARTALFTALLVAMASAASAHDPVSIRDLAERQVGEATWNRGDLEGALAAYCPSSDIMWVNSSGVSRGFEGFQRSMRSMFGGGKDRMGQLAISVQDVRMFGDGSNLTIVRWSITRGGRRQMGGISTQLWSDCDGRMRIVFEHSS